MPATAPRPQEQEYYYDSNDSVLDLDAEFPDIAQRVVQWTMPRQGTAPLLSWWPRDFGKVERACYEREPDLREVINQNRQGRVAANIPVQPVTPLMPPHQETLAFQSVRDLDQQRQWCFNQTIAKWQPSPLEDDHRKRTKTPHQPEMEDAPSGEHAHMDRHAGHEHGCSLTRRGDERQELDKARSKSRACCKSRAWSKSRVHSKSKACKGKVREERSKSKAHKDEMRERRSKS